MVVNGITVNVLKKNIKNVHLYVKPPDGEVMLTCPLDYPDENIALFVRTKLGWIRRKKEEYAVQPRQTERQYVSGETVYLWGKQYFLQVDYDARSYNITIDGNKVIFVVRKNSTTEQRRSAFTEWYRRIFKQELEKLVPKWENITGLKCSKYEVLNMRSKWGSCNHDTRKVVLNLQLAKKDFQCVEFVILHELVHIKEKNHTKRFVSIMDSYMPNWREVKNKLNSQPLAYYWEV